MDFVWTNALTVFIDLMNWGFYQLLDLFIIEFIDDILVYFKSGKEHANHLQKVLQTLKDQ